MHMINTKSSSVPLNLNPQTTAIIKQISEEFANVSDSQRNELLKENLELHAWEGERIQKVSVKRIIEPFGFWRLGPKDDYDDLKSITKPDPIKVAAALDDRFVLVDGLRRLRYHIKEGRSKIEVEIIGQARCLSQLNVARAMLMTRFNKPMSNLELAQGLVHLRTELHREFGKDAFFEHGGDRKGKGKNRQTAAKYMASLLGMQIWAVRELINFGLRLGPYALAGLQNKDDFKNISLKKIQEINPAIKRGNLKEEIGNRLDSMKQSDVTEDEMVIEAGKIAFDFIRGEMAEEEGSGSDDDTDESEVKVDTSDLDDPEKGKGKAASSKSKDDDMEDDDDVEEGDQDLEDVEEDDSSDKQPTSWADARDLLSELIDQATDLKRVTPKDKALPMKEAKVVQEKWGNLKATWSRLAICMKNLM